MERFEKLINLVGKDKFNKLKNSNVIVFGLGGVGGYVVEGLVRSGIGCITLVDFDVVEPSNINRQIIALESTVGESKTMVMKQRVLQINPKCQVTTINEKIDAKNIDKIDFKKFDYVIDAIDMVTSKIAIIKKAKECGANIISCMGTGNKLDIKALEIVDIEKTSVCPLAKVIRKLLRQEGIKEVDVLYSKETPKANIVEKRPQSAIFVPAVAGLMIANFVIKKLMGL